MPFDLCDPRPPTVYSNPLRDFYQNANANSESTLGGPLDRYDTSGGSFPPRVSRCSLNSATPARNEKTYIARYLRTNLLATNPATLCAVKNTRILKSLLENPPLTFTPAKFARGPCRSTAHFELNARHERTLCAITDNLRDEQKNRRALDLQKRAQNLQKFVHATRSEQSNADDVKRILTKQTKVRLSGSVVPSTATVGAIGGRKRSSDGAKSTRLIDICQKGDLLTHVRQNVERRILKMDLEDVGAIKHILPAEKDIPFVVEESRGEEAYEYASHGAMASLCSAKRSANVFYESRSERELHRERKASVERLQRMSTVQWRVGGAPKGLAFSPSLLTSVGKAQAPSPALLKGALKVSSGGKEKERWTHLGLIEEAKKDILRDTSHKLVRREVVATPRELWVSVYGPLKDVPENPLKGPLLPLPLAVKGFPPTQRELERVERGAAVQKSLDKEKRRRRLLERNNFYAPYARALLTDSEEEVGEVPHELDEMEGQPERLADLLDSSLLISGVNSKATRRTIPKETSLRFSQLTQSEQKIHSKPSSAPVPDLRASKVTSDTNIERKLSQSSVENDIERKLSKSSLENEMEGQRYSKSSLKKSIAESVEKKMSRSQPVARFKSEARFARKLSKSSLERFAERRGSEVERVIASAARTPEEAEEDVAFSDVAVPKIEGIHDAAFYRHLALGELSSSGNSDDETDVEEEEEEVKEEELPLAHSEFSIIALLEKEDEEEEETEEVEEAGSTTFKTAEDDEVTRRMREMLGDNLDVEFVFRTDPVWRRLVKVEAVPPQITLREESPPKGRRNKAAELPPLLQQALYDFKRRKEEERVRRGEEMEEERRRDVGRYRTSVFGVYTPKKKSKVFQRLFHNQRRRAKSVYELSPRLVGKKRKSRKRVTLQETLN